MLETYSRPLSPLSPRDRRRFAPVIAAVLAAGAAEVVGMAAILPLLALVAQPDLVHGGGLLSALHDRGAFAGMSGFPGALRLASSSRSSPRSPPG